MSLYQFQFYTTFCDFQIYPQIHPQTRQLLSNDTLLIPVNTLYFYIGIRFLLNRVNQLFGIQSSFLDNRELIEPNVSAYKMIGSIPQGHKVITSIYNNLFLSLRQPFDIRFSYFSPLSIAFIQDQIQIGSLMRYTCDCLKANIYANDNHPSLEHNM